MATAAFKTAAHGLSMQRQAQKGILCISLTLPNGYSGNSLRGISMERWFNALRHNSSNIERLRPN
jgi:hypothetical protein